MCTLPLCCSNDSQKHEWKITNTEKKNREKKEGKKLHFENTRLVSHNMHSSCDLLMFYNFLVNPQNPERRTTYIFKRWLIKTNFEFLKLFLEAGSNLVQFCTKFKVMWVLFLLSNVQVCGYWYCAVSQCSKVIGFVKYLKEVYGY